MLSASDVKRIPILALDRKRKITKKTPVASKSVIACGCLTLFQQASLAWALIQLSNDVELNPGLVPAEMCYSCSRSIAIKHRAIPCSNCSQRLHIKCAGLSAKDFLKWKYGTTTIDNTWECSKFLWSQLPLDWSFDSMNCGATDNVTIGNPDVNKLAGELNDTQERSDDSAISENVQPESLRKNTNKELLMYHLNINSIQNKSEDFLQLLIKKIGAHVFVAGYPDAQFSIPGYALYRNDREKGGGGIMVLVSSFLTNKRLKLSKNYETLEPIALEVKTDLGNMIVLGIYRPPRAMC